MNQELLQMVITFFKEQHGTYESLCTQLLSRGIKQEEIDQLYQEVKKLGLDHVVNLPPLNTIPDTPGVPDRSTLDTPKNYVRTFPPTIATLGILEGAPASQVAPQGGVTPQPTVPAPQVAPVQSSSLVSNLITLLLITLIGVGGLFIYIVYDPKSSLANAISPLLVTVGLGDILPKIMQPATSVVVATSTPEKESTTVQSASSTPQINPMNTEMINGIPVPALPNTQTNASSILGVDINTNGVRDDIERAIAKNLRSSSNYPLALQYAREYQALSTNPLPKTRTEALEKFSHFFCVINTVPRYPNAVLDDISALDIEGLTEEGTPARRKAYDAFYDILVDFSSEEVQVLCKK